MRILMLGNSLTAANDMPAMLADSFPAFGSFADKYAQEGPCRSFMLLGHIKEEAQNWQPRDGIMM